MNLREEYLKELQDEATAKYEIFVDMDGVLCNFDERFEYFFDMPIERYRERFGNQAAYNKISDMGKIFWSAMKWQPGGKELWSHVSKYNPSLLTSPGYFTGAEEGKKEWSQDHLSPQPAGIYFRQAEDKSELSGANKILIDDRADTIQQWIAKGGIGILHVNTPQTLEILSKYYL